MSEPAQSRPAAGPPAERPVVAPPSTTAIAVGAVLFVGIAVAGLTWAKWWPYSHKLAAVLSSHAYPDHSVLDAAGPAGAGPSWRGAWSFAVAYGESVWVALVAALLVAAGIESLLPRGWLVRVLSRPGRFGGPVAGGLLAVPCMMCTCCTAPVTTSLRRSGVPTSSALAYWMGNPVLNPAVLAFLALALPWQYAVTRLVIGALLVFVLTALIGRLRPSGASTDALPRPAQDEPFSLRAAPARFVRALARLMLTLVPEYFIVVLAVGAFRGWLLPLNGSAASWGLAAVLLAAVAGTLFVIPTGGEIPIISGLLVAGFGAGVTGALLIALPAVSLPSMIMVGRALSWRVTTVTAGAVAACGLAAAALLWALGG